MYFFLFPGFYLEPSTSAFENPAAVIAQFEDGSFTSSNWFCCAENDETCYGCQYPPHIPTAEEIELQKELAVLMDSAFVESEVR